MQKTRRATTSRSYLASNKNTIGSSSRDWHGTHQDLRENGSAMSLKALGQACCACAEQRSLPLLRRAAVTGRLASPGRLLTWKPAVGPAFCLFEAKLHHQRVRQRTRIHAGNGKDTPAVQGIATMMRALPSVMPQLKQRKQKERKATGSTKGDSVSRRCHRQILLGQGPCALAKCFVSTETRRHDVGRLAALALKGPLHGCQPHKPTKAQSPPCCRPGRPGCSARGLRQPAALKVFFGRGAILVQPTRRAWAVSLCEPCMGHRHVSRSTVATWSGNCSFHAKPDQAFASTTHGSCASHPRLPAC
ncbi:unnamed protein product [Symbiodinium sp. KB8]|nr:unnamed protein product [Symbiodinium sp. KB8]